MTERVPQSPGYSWPDGGVRVVAAHPQIRIRVIGIDMICVGPTTILGLGETSRPLCDGVRRGRVTPVGMVASNSGRSGLGEAEAPRGFVLKW